jgi:hypothetical protein
MCIRQVLQKIDIFMVYLKKRKFVLLKILFLAPNFIFFTHATKKDRIFMKRLCWHVAREDC